MKLHNFFPILPFFFLLVVAATATNTATTSLAEQVCKNTTNYTFCSQAIFSDSRAPTADRYVLSYISFDLAYTNATKTLDYINSSFSFSISTTLSLIRLRKCRGFYEDAVRALSQALNDLDSETFLSLDSYARKASGDASRCEDQFVVVVAGGGDEPALLSEMNRNLRGLSEICLVVSALYQV